MPFMYPFILTEDHGRFRRLLHRYSYLSRTREGKTYISFYSKMVFNCMNIYFLFTHSLIHGYLGCFHFGAILNKAVMNIWFYFWTSVLWM